VRILAIREAAVPVRSTMRNAAFDFSEMTTSIVAVITDAVRAGRQVVGYAFNSTGRYACGAAMRERFIPRILSADPDALLDAAGLLDPSKVLGRMMLREKPGGDAERSIPIGTIETAVWDALAKYLDRPLWHVLSERFNGGRRPERVPCYVGGGWYSPDGDLSTLAREIRGHLEAGYTHVKIKVGGAPIDADLKRVETALGILGAPDRLAVDANAALSPDRARDYARALAPYGLRWFEEPCAPLDFATFRELTEVYGGPLATGENLFSLLEVDNLHRFGGFRNRHDILQVDPPQAYGISRYAEMLALVEAHGGTRSTVFPHGGNMMSFAVVAGMGLGGCEAYPGVFAEFGGFADSMMVSEGYLNVPDAPGIGFEAQPQLYRLMRELADPNNPRAL
jgi:L-alanine-DL-glutamate epimerase-like enolase superfamily enzyme